MAFLAAAASYTFCLYFITAWESLPISWGQTLETDQYRAARIQPQCLSGV